MKRELKGWDANRYQSVDAAEQELDAFLSAVIRRHVKMVKPGKPKPAPWWNDACQSAYVQKCKLFAQRLADPVKCINYNAALCHSRTVQNRAFAQYQKVLMEKFNSM